MDRGADIWMADAEPPFEQRLRAEGAEQRDLHRGGDDPPHLDAAGENSMNLTKRALREGDTLVVWRLDRLGRSLRHLIDTITELNARGVGFKSLTENIDTTTSGGKLVFHIFGALAEFEREIIRERTQAGLASARSRGKVGGRPKALTPKELQILRNMASDKSLTVSDICKTLGIGRTTFYRYVKAG
jgi:DNA invertase Pin-like site-specific DNA recombinase